MTCTDQLWVGCCAQTPWTSQEGCTELEIVDIDQTVPDFAVVNNNACPNCQLERLARVSTRRAISCVSERRRVETIEAEDERDRPHKSRGGKQNT